MKHNVIGVEGNHPCTGCGVCSSVCPHSAIKLEEDSNGFYHPIIEESKCVSCAVCLKVCSKYDEDILEEGASYECYSATNKDGRELSESSSGGVSIELMRECLAQGFYVVGAMYDVSQNRTFTKIAKTPQELEQFKGSKYMQSNTQEAFKAVVQDSSEQKYAIFGTPCQIYAFQKLARVFHKTEKYLFVDIFCHGCPSMLLWDKYLDYIKSENKWRRIDEIRFRTKTHGWHEYCHDFYASQKKYSSSKYNDPFNELFFGEDAMNESCYSCIARNTFLYTDIRIGDFWGKRHDANSKGVSAVVLCTEKGKKLFAKVADKFEISSADFEEIVRGQTYRKQYPLHSSRRDAILSMLRGEEALTAVVQKRRKMLSKKANLKRILKGLLKHLPQPIYFRIKKIIK